MPLNTAQIAQIYEILGVPQHSSGSVLVGITGSFGPVIETYDLNPVIDRIDACIATLQLDQANRILALLARHAVVSTTNPLQLTAASGGARGTIVDYPAEREAIRGALGNLLGIAVPTGGFVAEAQRRVRGGGTVTR